jgi:hypothetical protein
MICSTLCSPQQSGESLRRKNMAGGVFRPMVAAATTTTTIERNNTMRPPQGSFAPTSGRMGAKTIGTCQTMYSPISATGSFVCKEQYRLPWRDLGKANAVAHCCRLTPWCGVKAGISITSHSVTRTNLGSFVCSSCGTSVELCRPQLQECVQDRLGTQRIDTIGRIHHHSIWGSSVLSFPAAIQQGQLKHPLICEIGVVSEKPSSSDELLNTSRPKESKSGPTMTAK